MGLQDIISQGMEIFNSKPVYLAVREDLQGVPSSRMLSRAFQYMFSDVSEEGLPPCSLSAGTQYIGGRLDSTVGLNNDKNSLTLPGIELRSLCRPASKQ
jgi:hypothetical protein